MTIKLSDFVIKFISGLGVKHVFLLPGGGSMHLIDSLGKFSQSDNNLKPICCLHEQSAAIAADAYSQYTNNIGVALVTTGPGGTNAITGVTASYIDSTPLLVISGQVKTSDMLTNQKISKRVRQMGSQEVDIVSLVKPITKYAITITDPNTIKYHLEKAVYLAKSGRPGPVWIDIPLDVQGAIIDKDNLKDFDLNLENKIKFFNDIAYTMLYRYISNIKKSIKEKDLTNKIKKVISLINQSKRPVILAGNGVRLAKAEIEFLYLVEKLKIPVLTTWRTIDFFSEDSPYYFGRPGSIASRYANFIQQNADFILCIGARLDLAQVGYNYNHFSYQAKKVVVDVDRNELSKFIFNKDNKMKIDIPICTDAKIFIQKFIRYINQLCPTKKYRNEWIEKCNYWKNKYPVILSEYNQEDNNQNKPVNINTYALIDILSEVMTPNDILIPGSSGSCAEITMQSFKVKSTCKNQGIDICGQRVLNNPGLGSMGFGLPASIGACLASNNRRTICIIGDGGLQHNIQELETIKRLNLPIKIFILNNNGYASIRNMQNRVFNGRLVCCDPSSGLTLPDTCKIASAYDIKSYKINQINLKEEVQKVLETEGPVICEVIVDPDLQTIPRVSSTINSDGTIESRPMEDLYPFLDRKEFIDEMTL